MIVRVTILEFREYGKSTWELGGGECVATVVDSLAVTVTASGASLEDMLVACWSTREKANTNTPAAGSPSKDG